MSEPDKKWGHNPDTGMVILTFILMLVGGYTAWIFYGQFGEMKAQTAILNQQAKQASMDSVEATKKVEQQLEISRQQVSAAQANVKAVQRQMRQDQRAWISSTTETVGAGIPATGQAFLIRTTFKNIGKSAALNVRTCIGAAFLPKEQMPDFKCPDEIMHFVSIGTMFPSSATFNDLLVSPTFQAVDRDKIMSNTWNMWVYGRVEYADVFGVPHWFNFCSHLLSGGGYAICDKHTETDRNY